MRLLVATGNAHKLEEFGRILVPLGVEVVAPDQIHASLDVEETGETFAENARLKALALYRQTGLPTVADDSGLCVDALDGRPGVHSARYRGAHTTHAEKIRGILEELADVPPEKRTARFVASICCVLGEADEIACEGVCEGTIAAAPAGDGGFGYDPIFLVDGRSFGQLSPEEKDAVSHRGMALRSFVRLLRGHLDG